MEYCYIRLFLIISDIEYFLNCLRNLIPFFFLLEKNALKYLRIYKQRSTSTEFLEFLGISFREESAWYLKNSRFTLFS
jgi:hypothetical protein